jgi:hypothetical protein
LYQVLLGVSYCYDDLWKLVMIGCEKALAVGVEQRRSGWRTNGSRTIDCAHHPLPTTISVDLFVYIYSSKHVQRTHGILKPWSILLFSSMHQWTNNMPSTVQHRLKHGSVMASNSMNHHPRPLPASIRASLRSLRSFTPTGG